MHVAFAAVSYMLSVSPLSSGNSECSNEGSHNSDDSDVDSTDDSEKEDETSDEESDLEGMAPYPQTYMYTLDIL